MDNKERPSITILKDTTPNIFCIEVTGIVTKEDYEKYVYAPIKHMQDTQETFRILAIIQAEYKGITPEAAEMDLAFSLESNRDQTDKVAIVTYDTKHQTKLGYIAAFIEKGEFKMFNGDEIDIAKKWIFEG